MSRHGIVRTNDPQPPLGVVEIPLGIAVARHGVDQDESPPDVPVRAPPSSPFPDLVPLPAGRWLLRRNVQIHGSGKVGEEIPIR
jgi:hypothetical protein